MTPTSRPRRLDGILLVDKPAGMTSAGVVRDVKKRLGGPKVGHLGTLDPFATGLLPLALGEASKVVQFLNQEEKAYTGTIALGSATDTLDFTGRVIETAAVATLDRARLDEVTRSFIGEIDQIPPMYSALKRGGVPLYELARRGEDVDLPARRVRIAALSLVATSQNTLEIAVRCSKGTYVRSLARDIARRLGTVGHLASLRRTAFGAFQVSRAVPLAEIGACGALPLLPPREAMGGVRELEVDDRMATAIRRGQQASLQRLSPPGRSGDELAKLIDRAGELVAIVGKHGSGWKLLRVFPDVGSLDSG